MSIGLLPGKRNLLRQKLYERDGTLCFYCGEELIHPDITFEHLVASRFGGSNRIENLVLAHAKCNGAAGHLPVVEKIKFRETLQYGKPLGYYNHCPHIGFPASKTNKLKRLTDN